MASAPVCVGLPASRLRAPFPWFGDNEDSRDVAHQVRDWAIANGDNPELRIGLCGYEGEHAMPKGWNEVRWKANGGFGNQSSGRTRGRENASRERIWFSPHCLAQPTLFEGETTHG